MLIVCNALFYSAVQRLRTIVKIHIAPLGAVGGSIRADEEEYEDGMKGLLRRQFVVLSPLVLQCECLQKRWESRV